jgi:ABC-type transporter Mla subunit MlaD
VCSVGLAATLVAGGAACSNDDNASSTTTTSIDSSTSEAASISTTTGDAAAPSDDFATQANALCANVGEQIDALFAQSPPTPDTYDELLSELVDDTRQLVDDLRGLQPPADLEAQYTAVLDDTESIADEVEAQGGEAFFSSQDDPFGTLDPQFEALGLDQCASGGEEG